MGVHHDNKIAARKSIAGLIDALKSESDRAGRDQPLSAASLKQLSDTIARLQEQVAIYSYLQSTPEEPPVIQQVFIEKPQPGIPVKHPEPVAEKKPEPVAETKPEPVAEKKPEPVVEIKPEPAAEKKPEPVAENKIVPEVKPEPAPAPPPAKPRADIKTMIGFNEKLMFQRYLFGGDAAAYEEALKQINASASHEEASAFISVVSSSYKWPADSEPAQVFQSIVKRRFA